MCSLQKVQRQTDELENARAPSQWNSDDGGARLPQGAAPSPPPPAAPAPLQRVREALQQPGRPGRAQEGSLRRDTLRVRALPSSGEMQFHLRIDAALAHDAAAPTWKLIRLSGDI